MDRSRVAIRSGSDADVLHLPQRATQRRTESRCLWVLMKERILGSVVIIVSVEVRAIVVPQMVVASGDEIRGSVLASEFSCGARKLRLKK